MDHTVAINGPYAKRRKMQVYKCSKVLYFVKLYSLLRAAVAQWLRCCATNRKVAGSILVAIALWSWGPLSL